MKPIRSLLSRRLAIAVVAGGLPFGAAAFDYPTLDRVRFVEECMRDHPGSKFEMTSKCSCVIDRVAEQIPIDDFVTGATAVKANSISGERGNTIRDTDMLQTVIKTYRGVLVKAKQACFINLEAR